MLYINETKKKNMLLLLLLLTNILFQRHIDRIVCNVH